MWLERTRKVQGRVMESLEPTKAFSSHSERWNQNHTNGHRSCFDICSYDDNCQSNSRVIASIMGKVLDIEVTLWQRTGTAQTAAHLMR